MKRLPAQNRADIQKLASSLAQQYSGQDIAIGLIGPLGAGKTAFAKDFAADLGLNKIKSPTFTIGSAYKFNHGDFYHYDLYRLDDSKQLEALGLDEIFAQSHRIILIEWVDKFPELLARCNLVITFKIIDHDTRYVTIQTSPN